MPYGQHYNNPTAAKQTEPGTDDAPPHAGPPGKGIQVLLQQEQPRHDVLPCRAMPCLLACWAACWAAAVSHCSADLVHKFQCGLHVNIFLVAQHPTEYQGLAHCGCG